MVKYKAFKFGKFVCCIVRLLSAPSTVTERLLVTGEQYYILLNLKYFPEFNFANRFYRKYYNRTVILNSYCNVKNNYSLK